MNTKSAANFRSFELDATADKLLQTLADDVPACKAEIIALDMLIIPSIKNIELFISRNIRINCGIKCLNSSSLKPKVDAPIIWKPSNITTRTNKPSAIASTISHKLNTLAFVAIIGVELVNEFKASINGFAAVSIIFL